MSAKHHTVTTPHGQVSYLASGAGSVVVMLASLGRPAEDFNHLAARLSDKGYRTIAVQPRGVGGTDRGIENPTMGDLAEDIVAVIDAEAGEVPVFIIGHAFGNRLARTVAVMYPVRVRALVLLAAGGKVPIAKKARDALIGTFVLEDPEERRLEDIRYALFAEGNPVPPEWIDNWYPDTATLQSSAVQSVSYESFWSGGGRPMLVIAGKADTIAPVEDTVAHLKESYGDQISVAELEAAGHALLPEQPEKIATLVFDYLKSQGEYEER
ncbi:MAG: alpha/beta hydrolase [Parvularculales bacterium]